MHLGEGVVRLASLVAIFVGIITIVKEFRNMVVSAVSSIYHWYVDRRVLRLLKAQEKHGFYEPADLAHELGRKPRQVLQALHRLEKKHKVRHTGDVDEVTGGLWGLHEWEQDAD